MQKLIGELDVYRAALRNEQQSNETGDTNTVVEKLEHPEKKEPQLDADTDFVVTASCSASAGNGRRGFCR